MLEKLKALEEKFKELSNLIIQPRSKVASRYTNYGWFNGLLGTGLH